MVNLFISHKMRALESLRKGNYHGEIIHAVRVWEFLSADRRVLAQVTEGSNFPPMLFPIYLEYKEQPLLTKFGFSMMLKFSGHFHTLTRSRGLGQFFWTRPGQRLFRDSGCRRVVGGSGAYPGSGAPRPWVSFQK